MTDQLNGVVTPVFGVNDELARDLTRDCVRLEIEEGLEGLRCLRADLVAVGAGAPGPPQPMSYLDGQVIDFGKQLTVSLGPDDAQRKVFDGTITGIEAVYADGEPPRVIVHAEDSLMKLRMTRRSKTYSNVTDADIAREIARAHGMQAEVDVDGPRYDVVQQLNQSDLAFLRDRARGVQAEIWCVGQALHVSSRPKRQGTAITLAHGDQLVTVSLLADLAHQRSEVVVTGYDARSKAVINERAGADTINIESSGGRTGPQIVQRALGGSGSLRVRDVALTSEEATAWAKAEMLRRARAFVVVSGTTRGTPDMMVGSQLTLGFVGPTFDGTGYYVTRLRHTWENVQGLRTHFEAERPTVNAAA